MTLESDLRKKARRNTLGVEDLFEVARKGQPSDADVLDQIAQSLQWPMEVAVDGPRVVPLGRWVLVVNQFLRKGYEGLEALTKDPYEGLKNTSFVLGLLGEIHTANALESVLNITNHLRSLTEVPPDVLRKCVDAFNLLLSFPPFLKLPLESSRTIREFLGDYFLKATSDADRAAAICALRGVGDLHSITLIKDSPPLQPPWSDVKKIAISAITKRLNPK